MRWFVLSVAVLSASAVADDAIAPIFEANSSASYNDWLAQHRNQYPNLQPVGTHSDIFTDSGAVLPSKVLEFQARTRDLVGLQTPYVTFADDSDHCVLHYGYGRDVATAVYGRHGRTLFERSGYVQHRFDMWFVDTEDSLAAWRHFHSEIPVATESTLVLDDDGKVVGFLPRIPVWRATASGDSLFAAVSPGGALVFDREARVRWQDSMIGGASRLAAISPDARRVAAVARDSIVIHDMVTGRSSVLRIPSVTVTGRRTHLVVWSNDSRNFAIYRADSYGPGSSMLWVFTRDGRPAAKPRRLDANYGEQLFWMGDTVVLTTTPLVDSLEERLRDKHWFVGPSRVTAVPLRGHARTWMVNGQFREGSDWFQQGRCLASVSMGNAVVFEVPAK